MKQNNRKKKAYKKKTQVFSDILDVFDYRGQWGNTYTLDEKDLSYRFYKYYGRSSLIITLKDYVETGHSGKDSEKIHRTAKEWYERITNGLSKMKTLDFMNNNIIPLGNNNDEEKI